jgi:hypothetical protein
MVHELVVSVANLAAVAGKYPLLPFINKVPPLTPFATSWAHIVSIAVGVILQDDTFRYFIVTGNTGILVTGLPLQLRNSNDVGSDAYQDVK